MGDLAGLLAQLDDDAPRRGAQFEEISRWFLLNDPEYRDRIERVWTWRE